ncbi:SETDB1 [Mytilus coruscus]|uniref:SETDB1 n=1 Tax=Mytilus coruscus TaxID=42192 RepID=A0A6J8E5P4_MYTCO|nr:SETDB1 [Mytilus coruscus]
MGRKKGWFKKGHQPGVHDVKKEEEDNENEDSAKKPKTDLDMEESDVSDDTVYKFDFDLDELIGSTITDLTDPDKDEDTIKYRQTLNNFSTQLKTVESKQKQVTKILDECDEKIQQYREELEDLDKEEEQKEAAAELAAKDAAEANAKNEETDSDDDVQFISTSFDPDVAAKNKTIVEQSTNLIQTLNNTSPSKGPRTIILKVPASQASAFSANSSPEVGKSKLENLRAALAATINKQVHQVLTPITSLASPQQPVQQAPPGASVQLKAPEVPNARQVIYGSLTLTQTASAYFPAVEALARDSKVFGKKMNEVWYRGSIETIQNRQQPVNERKYMIKFDGKGRRPLSAREIAFRDHINITVAVGTRIVALYRDEESTASFYAGIIAETPNGRNQFRYLVFFDDGYAQYSTKEEIHKVVDQSINVWEDVHQDSQEFIKEYLKQYPERPMVRLHKGQQVKTEWNGKWWTAKVVEVDASLVKMFFLADKREELIYRGSTRLEPLYSALANQEQTKMTGKVKRHNLDSSKQKAVVEYTRGQSNDNTNEEAPIKLERSTSQEGTKKRAVARKSTAGDLGQCPHQRIVQPQPQKKKPEITQIKTENGTAANLQKSTDFIASSISSNKAGKDMASLLQERLSKTDDPSDIEECMGERVESTVNVPIQNRQKQQMDPHSCCHKCLKDLEDNPVKFRGTNPLLIPLLCGWERHVCKVKPGGRRMVAYRAPCGRRLRNMQELDKYLGLTDSQMTIDLFCYDPVLHVHTEFVPVKTFCDIKDLSYGKESVPIQCVNGIDRQYPDYVEYSNVRIPAKGVNLNLNPEFMACCDCTDNCRDKSKCACQQLTVDATAVSSSGKPNPNAGLEHRRLKEPLITGVFECNASCSCDQRCINRVVQNGLQVRLQVFKTEKKGWGLRCLDDLAKGNFICIYAGQLLTEQGANETTAVCDFSGDDYKNTGQSGTVLTTRRSSRNRSDPTGKQLGKIVLRRDSSRSGVKDEEWSVKSTPVKQQSSSESPIMIDDDEDELDQDKNPSSQPAAVKQSASADSMGDSDSLPDLDAEPVVQETEKQREKEKKVGTKNITQERSRRTALAPDEPNLEDVYPDEEGVKRFARRSTTANKTSRFKNLPDPRKKLTNVRMEDVTKEEEEEEEQEDMISTRSYFQDGQECYIMDAKSMGNIGRYLNHSCTPNVFVQNIFVDTHDLRFPWVTFWAGQYIRAGTELTWDYNYEVGSVPGKVLYCYCGSSDCRGRLL